MRILVSGGGTGGHIYPALSLVKALQERDPGVEVLYIGTKLGLENKIVAEQGLDFLPLDVQGIRRSLSLSNLVTAYKYLTATSKAKNIIKKFQPDIVVGTGGYVCAPVVRAAAGLEIPTIIHEQNSLPGITNKFLAKKVSKIAICFEEARNHFPGLSDKIVLTGNPRASEVALTKLRPKSALGLNPYKKTVLISGGSRGAEPINEAFIEKIRDYEAAPYEVLFVTGEKHYEDILSRIPGHEALKNVQIRPFIANMPQYLVATDLYVGRSGATFLSEVTALGVPSILIPSPWVTENHQEFNARSITDHGGGTLVLEAELTGDSLLREINKVMEDHSLHASMKRMTKKLGIPDASGRLLAVVDGLLEKG
ncbi:MAG: undecaprenyldiphospho-muramoylpentapeptide beta-N-acetylglucosaminyltransferase [Turicibacter sp.]|nr:undecaprenyldiphospho-muramoylpentapeptide beta-N-acetylglucosaminyltransferase [Turicibacter sp.]